VIALSDKAREGEIGRKVYIFTTMNGKKNERGRIGTNQRI